MAFVGLCVPRGTNILLWDGGCGAAMFSVVFAENANFAEVAIAVFAAHLYACSSTSVHASRYSFARSVDLNTKTQI